MAFFKEKLFVFSLGVIVITSALTIYVNYDPSRYQNKIDLEKAISQANHLYNLRKIMKTDFSSGPCLSNALMPGWVVDIAHNPRIPLDDLEQNQCQSFIEGSAKHFVELDPDGNLIRAK